MFVVLDFQLDDDLVQEVPDGPFLPVSLIFDVLVLIHLFFFLHQKPLELVVLLGNLDQQGKKLQGEIQNYVVAESALVVEIEFLNVLGTGDVGLVQDSLVQHYVFFASVFF